MIEKKKETGGSELIFNRWHTSEIHMRNAYSLITYANVRSIILAFRRKFIVKIGANFNMLRQNMRFFYY